MATTSITISPSHLPTSLVLRPKPHALVPSSFPSRRKLSYPNPPCALPLKTGKGWKISAFRDSFLLLEASTVENSQELVSAGDDGASSIIFALLFVAFVGLSILTVGVIYMGVTDFLQKREREQFEKEEAAAKKKRVKKGKMGSRARAGPRGFGQKIEEDGGDELD
ncbi:uncharacterized protein LOC113762330 [Coffea eugenioides]|uniref:uncharacterized protein LOC113762330 n=1 Tax=Coffea eugenioides TaxID=49369 RepID=UPI000F605862|nr:uncharacterized protein LOC113762330 [Coffea eugenioides]